MSKSDGENEKNRLTFLCSSNIKIETVSEIYSALCEVCEMDTTNRHKDGIGDSALVL